MFKLAILKCEDNNLKGSSVYGEFKKRRFFKNDNIYKNQQSDYDFNLFENIITQNEKNLYLFNNLSHLENIVVTELPDFKVNDETIITNNECTVIGVIGHISNIKGSDFLRYLIKCFKYTKIKIVIFGKLSNFNYKHCYPYDNINDLNNLLKIHKPNMLLECSLWPETYSYTLTLSMLTELPILILKKKYFGVIDNRIKNYDKKTYFKRAKPILKLKIKKKPIYLCILINVYKTYLKRAKKERV
jgi:hypothetical protein